MAMPSGLRIGDAEREAAAADLREHYALGRLDADEFQERLDAVFAARTDRDLARIASDLPSAARQRPGPIPGAGPDGFRPDGTGQNVPGPYPGRWGPGYYRRRHGGSWVRVAVLIAIVAFVVLPTMRMPFGVFLFAGKAPFLILLLIAFLGRRFIFRMIRPRRGPGRTRRPRPF